MKFTFSSGEGLRGEKFFEKHTVHIFFRDRGYWNERTCALF